MSVCFICENKDATKYKIEELLSKKEMKINENLAKDILNFVNKQKCWNGVIIYFNGKAWKDTTTWNGDRYSKIIKFPKRDKYGEYDGVYEFENKNPLTYFSYANLKTVSVSFDGPFYDFMNRYGDINKLQEIFAKYNMYFEWGDSWNITGFKI